MNLGSSQENIGSGMLSRMKEGRSMLGTGTDSCDLRGILACRVVSHQQSWIGNH